MRRPGTVTASLHRLDGSLIASTSFAAMAGEPAIAGVLKATLPEEGIVIARTELSDGGAAAGPTRWSACQSPVPPRGARF
jgi:hypothetical protein